MTSGCQEVMENTKNNEEGEAGTWHGTAQLAGQGSYQGVDLIACLVAGRLGMDWMQCTSPAQVWQML